jgi:phenylalanyl-tRNA synthetase alpha chain
MAGLAQCTDEQMLDDWRIRFLGRRGELTQVLRGLAELPLEERRTVGAAANQLKSDLEAAYEERREAIRLAEVQRVIEEGRIDVTLPARPLPRGRLHPVTQTLQEILRAFTDMGFRVVEGPEVEWDRYNFELLRIPKDHPARDMWDTIWIDFERDGERPMVLRTHTSPNQIRVMERQQPPVRVVVPGRCYRYEATDATHEWMMTQVEGLVVDEGISLAELKGTLAQFARRLFGQQRQIMLRHAYFPFVEPGVEMAVDCFACQRDGSECRVCSGTGWIELLGAGMVHPEVLANVGYDTTRYTGFAFGLGVERTAMLRHGIDDIRHFYANDLRFLSQF